MNTYGFLSINHSTINQQSGSNLAYPGQTRDLFVSTFAITNFSLRMLSYHPGMANVGAYLRIANGAVISLVTVSVGDPNATEGAIVGPWYGEMQRMGIFQMVRGGLDLWAPHGRTLNLIGDVVGTPVNLLWTFGWDASGSGAMEPKVSSHDDPGLIWLIAFAEPALALTRRIAMHSGAISQSFGSVGTGITNFLKPFAS